MALPLHRYGTRAVLGLSLIAAASTCVLAVGALTRPDLMLVEHVVFSGHDAATPGELRHLADVPNGTRMWEVETERMEDAIERHPWVRRATAERVWPNSVRVNVEEHRPVALLHFDRIHYVAADGSVFLPARSSDLDYPSITGITPALERQHPDLPGRVLAESLDLIERLDTRGLLSRARIDEVHFSQTRGFTVRSGGSKILFALDGLDRQLDRFASLLSSGTVDLDHATYVDLGPASVAIVRPLSAPQDG